MIENRMLLMDILWKAEIILLLDILVVGYTPRGRDNSARIIQCECHPYLFVDFLILTDVFLKHSRFNSKLSKIIH